MDAKPLSSIDRIFAIGDLHLPGGIEKPMHVFGEQWRDHFRQISEDWKARVGERDVVLLPGDISWAMYMQDALEDLENIAALPGRKVMIRGNHDYWWNSITKIRAVLPEGFYALQNDALALDDIVCCGTRGWSSPGAMERSEQDEKIYQRELQRLELSLTAAAKIAEGRPLVALLHFPPFNEKRDSSGFTELLEQFGVHTAVYGHLHAGSLRFAFSGYYHGVWLHNTSCDGLGFRLLDIQEAQRDMLKVAEVDANLM